MNILYKDLEQLIKELDKQIDNPKQYVNAVSINLYRMLDISMDVLPSELNITNVNNGEAHTELATSTYPLQDVPPRNEVYELFIPKEGLPPLENILSDEELKILKSQNVRYSNELLHELKVLLKERNPEITEEEEKFKKVR